MRNDQERGDRCEYTNNTGIKLTQHPGKIYGMIIIDMVMTCTKRQLNYKLCSSEKVEFIIIKGITPGGTAQRYYIAGWLGEEERQ